MLVLACCASIRFNVYRKERRTTQTARALRGATADCCGLRCTAATIKTNFWLFISDLMLTSSKWSTLHLVTDSNLNHAEVTLTLANTMAGVTRRLVQYYRYILGILTDKGDVYI
jgi:hypothetical protein